jgi:predicted metal-binding membrane protein
MPACPFHAATRHDRTVVLLGLAVLITASWIYLLLGAGIEMDMMDMGAGQVTLMTPAWTERDAALVLVMWIVMMAAMMLPSAAPAILRLVGPGRERTRTSGMASALLFTAGYLAVWIAFSVAATLLQWALDRADLLTGQVAIRSAVAAGWLVIAVGLYQLTPLKQACLRRCRSCADCRPQTGLQEAHFWTAQGARYGVSCFGCCGILMGLLLVGGVMNVFWMAAIATGVLAEKVLPWGGVLARLTGAGLIGWGSIWLAVAVI